jgi:predicted RNase H-like HicB family nuclease
VFEFRLRILDVRERDTDPPSFLGLVEGFPEILVHATTVEQAERNLVNALGEHLKGLMDHEATRLQLDDFPTVRAISVYLGDATRTVADQSQAGSVS